MTGPYALLRSSNKKKLFHFKKIWKMKKKNGEYSDFFNVSIRNRFTGCFNLGEFLNVFHFLPLINQLTLYWSSAGNASIHISQVCSFFFFVFFFFFFFYFFVFSFFFFFFFLLFRKWAYSMNKSVLNLWIHWIR